MANWQNRLDLKDLWEGERKGELTTQQVAKEVAKRIRAMRVYKKYEDELEEIATNFEYCEEDLDEFNDYLEDLYVWGDTPLPTPKGQMQKKLCWIKTF